MSHKLVLTCLVDNTVASLFAWGEHGLSFLVECEGQSILFDTGQSGHVLAHNLEALKQSGDKVRSIVLSHGHIDHTGGLRMAMNWAPGAEIAAHPGVFARRFAQRGEGSASQLEPIGLPFAREEIEGRAHLRLSAEMTEIAPAVWTTGQVPRTIDAGAISSRHLLQEGESLRPDLILDDQSLLLNTAQGLVLLLGCCHAGLLNTLEHVRRSFGRSVHAVVGGTHLGGAKLLQLQSIAAALRDDYGVEKLYLNHCTGPAIWPLMQALGERVRPCPAGMRLEF